VQLTDRERDVLTLLAKGLTVARVAEMLGISRNTAAGYAKTVYRKLNVTSRAEATLEAARRGLVRP
jgi:DNA-binding CsgD family transcriptional regulator